MGAGKKDPLPQNPSCLLSDALNPFACSSHTTVMRRAALGGFASEFIGDGFDLKVCLPLNSYTESPIRNGALER